MNVRLEAESEHQSEIALSPADFPPGHHELMSLLEQTESRDVSVDETSNEAEQDSVLGYLIASAEQMVIVFGLYVLSIGPMYWTWIEAKHVDGSHLIAAFYEPLWKLAGWIPPLGEWVNWYVCLWIY